MNYEVERLFIIVLCIFLLLLSQNSFAQAYDGAVGNNSIPSSYEGFEQSSNPPPGDMRTADMISGIPCEQQDPADPMCPVDDWVYVLLFLGVGYGFIKFRKHKVAVGR